MMRTRAWAYALVLLGLAAASYWLGRESASLPATVQGVGSVQHEVANPRAVGTTSESRRESSPRDSTALSVPAEAPLPAMGEPLAQIKDELAARARRGDARAACRLGADLMRCRSSLASKASSAMLQQALARSGQTVSDDTVSMLASMDNAAASAVALCEGIGEKDMREAIVYQRIAAERGSTRMRLWYAADPALERMDFLADLDEWQSYRAVALEYLEQALEAGDPDAPDVLAGVYQPRDDVIHTGRVPLRLPDAHRYFVYRELAALLHPGRPEVKSAVAAPEPGREIDLPAVRAEAEALRQKYYASYRPDATRQESPGVPGMFSGADDAQQICGP